MTPNSESSVSRSARQSRISSRSGPSPNRGKPTTRLVATAWCAGTLAAYLACIGCRAPCGARHVGHPPIPAKYDVATCPAGVEYEATIVIEPPDIPSPPVVQITSLSSDSPCVLTVFVEPRGWGYVSKHDKSESEVQISGLDAESKPVNDHLPLPSEWATRWPSEQLTREFTVRPTYLKTVWDKIVGQRSLKVRVFCSPRSGQGSVEETSSTARYPKDP